MMETLSEKLAKIADPFLKEMGAELVDLHIVRHKGNLTLRVLVDKLTGGISVNECSQLNRQIGDAIENAGLIAQYYFLEVSSPGLDRPLKTARDFARNTGREVRVFLREPVLERIEYQGAIAKVENENVTLLLDQGEVVIPIDKVNKAKQII